MKLIRLKLLDGFRSLPKNFEINFLTGKDKSTIWQFMPYCLVGRNGSGKSNVLEVLSSIFYHLECMHLQNLPANFVYDAEENTGGFRSNKATVDSFELEYYSPLKWEETDLKNDRLSKLSMDGLYAHISIKKDKGKSPSVQWLNREKYENNKDLNLTSLEIKRFFPDYVIGYSSGENEILSLPFLKMRFIHYDEYETALLDDLPYSQPEGRLIYFDNTLSQAIFLTNFLMHKLADLKPIYNSLGIKGIHKFRIIIRRDEVKNVVKPFEFGAESMNSALHKDEIIRKELTQKLHALIEKLKNCSTCWHESSGMLYLDYLISDEDKTQITKKAFQLNFDNNPILLFQSFQILLTLNLFDVSVELKRDLYENHGLYVNETVPTLASDRRIMRFKDLEIDNGKDDIELFNKSLSDGEHQFLHSIGICLLFKNTNSLFLLDEPETHFNPDWRSLFISTLRDCLNNDNRRILADFLITSHSPFIVSDCKPENVIIFSKSAAKVTRVSRPDFNTFGASVNLITNKIFHKEETISAIAIKRLKVVLDQFNKGKITKSKAILEVNQLGDSIEKLMIIDEIKRRVVKKKGQ